MGALLSSGADVVVPFTGSGVPDVDAVAEDGSEESLTELMVMVTGCAVWTSEDWTYRCIDVSMYVRAKLEKNGRRSWRGAKYDLSDDDILHDLLLMIGFVISFARV